MRAGTVFVFLAALSLPLAMQPSAAEERHGKRLPPGQVRSDGRNAQGFHREFRDGNIRHFPDHDHGEGRHDDHRFHGGHGGILFFYPGPIYPFPYSDSYYLSPPLYEAPQVPGYWYYCDDPPGYYPYVAECRRPWNTVAPGDAPPG